MEISRKRKIVDMRSEDAAGCPAIVSVSFCRETPKCSVLVLDLGLDLDLGVDAARAEDDLLSGMLALVYLDAHCPGPRRGPGPSRLIGDSIR